MPWKPPTHAELLHGRRDHDREYEERRWRDPALARAQLIRRSARWRKMRALKLSRDPLCEDCEACGVLTAATQVHHIVGLRTQPDLAFRMDNLASLCTACHARREAAERRR